MVNIGYIVYQNACILQSTHPFGFSLLSLYLRIEIYVSVVHFDYFRLVRLFFISSSMMSFCSLFCFFFILRNFLVFVVSCLHSN